MHYRRFGRTNLDVSVVGLGTGGASQLGQGSGVAEAEAHRVVRRALDLGINLIDTAADYRESEAILGRALRGVPRDSYILCTKFNPKQAQSAQGSNGYALKSEQDLIASFDRSLQRLGTDYVDLFQLHAVLPPTYPEVRDRFLPVMTRLQEQGKIRFLGITEAFSSDDQREMLRLALKDNLFDAMLVGYNLLTPGPEEDVFPEAQRLDVGILIMCAVRKKIGKPEKLEELVADLQARGELREPLPRTGPLDWLLHDGVDSVPAAAYKFAAGHPAVSCVLSGTANQVHLEQNVEAILGDPLPAADRKRLIELFRPIGRKLGE